MWWKTESGRAECAASVAAAITGKTGHAATVEISPADFDTGSHTQMVVTIGKFNVGCRWDAQDLEVDDAFLSEWAVGCARATPGLGAA